MITTRAVENSHNTKMHGREVYVNLIIIIIIIVSLNMQIDAEVTQTVSDASAQSVSNR